MRKKNPLREACWSHFLTQMGGCVNLCSLPLTASRRYQANVLSRLPRFLPAKHVWHDATDPTQSTAHLPVAPLPEGDPDGQLRAVLDACQRESHARVKSYGGPSKKKGTNGHEKTRACRQQHTETYQNVTKVGLIVVTTNAFQCGTLCFALRCLIYTHYVR